MSVYGPDFVDNHRPLAFLNLNSWPTVAVTVEFMRPEVVVFILFGAGNDVNVPIVLIVVQNLFVRFYQPRSPRLAVLNRGSPPHRFRAVLRFHDPLQSL